MTRKRNNDNCLQDWKTEHQAVTIGIFYCRVSAKLKGCSSLQTSWWLDSDVLWNRQQKPTANRYQQGDELSATKKWNGLKYYIDLAKWLTKDLVFADTQKKEIENYYYFAHLAACWHTSRHRKAAKRANISFIDFIRKKIKQQKITLLNNYNDY